MPTYDDLVNRRFRQGSPTPGTGAGLPQLPPPPPPIPGTPQTGQQQQQQQQQSPQIKLPTPPSQPASAKGKPPNQDDSFLPPDAEFQQGNDRRQNQVLYPTNQHTPSPLEIHTQILNAAQDAARARCPNGMAEWIGPYGPDVNAVFQGLDQATFTARQNDPANWRCAGGGGGGGGGAAPPPSGGGGGGGGAASSSFQSASLSQPDQELLNNIRNTLTAIFQGNDLPFSDEVRSAYDARALQEREAQRASARRAIDEDLVGRGLYRSGIGTGLVSEADQAAFENYSNQRREFFIKQAEENFSARERALENAASLLAQQQQFLLSSESNAITRQLGLSQIQLGYKRLAQELQIAREQFANQIKLAEMGLIGQGLFGSQYS